MGKIISAYGGFSSSDIKSRANIPAQTDMTISGSNVDCVNIRDTDVKNILGESVTGVGALCSSSKVNIWSWFSPRYWSHNGTDFINNLIMPYSLGSFSGYNHYANHPFWTTKDTVITHYEGNNSVQINSYIMLGEIDYKAILGSINKIKIDILDTDNNLIETNSIFVDSNYLHVQQNLYATINTTSYNYDKTLKIQIYFADNTDSKISSIPAIDEYNAVIKFYAYAAIGTNNLSDAVRIDNPTWSLLRGAASVQQGPSTYILNYNGIDSDGNGTGDVSAYLQIYARKNGGTWQSLGQTVEFIPGDTWGANGDLPFTLTYGDVVDFELRY